MESPPAPAQARPGRRWWRLRVAAAIVPVAAALVALVVVLPERTPLTAPALVPGATRTECLDVADIRTVARLDRFVRTVRGNPAFGGGDVGASASLQDGRLLFLFGDTVRGAEFDGAQVVRNSMLVVSRTCAEVVLPADAGAVMPTRPDDVGYWPMSVVTEARTGYDLVAVTSQRVRSNDSDAGVFAFDVLGPAAAVFVVPVGGTPQLIALRDLGADRVDPGAPMWGAAAVIDEGWLYLYGTSRPDGVTAGGFALQVARTRPDDLLRTDRWRYWDGSGWGTDPTRAERLVAADGGVSQTLSVFTEGGRWFAVSKRDEVLGSDLTIWAAPAATGPFTVASTPASIPSDGDTGTLRYMPLAHPDLLPRDGTVVVSYSENNTDDSVVVADPRRYRPRFIRVPLPATP